jgi:REP element-mobilizing transposase RayT
MMYAGGGSRDHVHIVASIPPTRAVSDMMRIIKTNSSRWIRQGGGGAGGPRRTFAWQEGYAAFSVSRSVLPRVVAYVRGQRGASCAHALS